MKRITTMMAVILMTASTTYGQGVGVGLKAGLNLSKINFDDATVTDESNRTGFHIGAFAKLMITKKFGIQPEAYYSIEGAKANFGTVADINTSYLQVPILLRYNPVPILNIHVGPQFGVILKGEQDANGTVTNIKDDLNSKNFAIAAGVGLDLPLGLSATVRYVKGLSDISDSSGSDRSNIFQISVGYQLFGLGK